MKELDPAEKSALLSQVEFFEGCTQREIDDIASSVGRDPAEIERSACMLVRLDPSSDERPSDPAVPAVTGSPDDIAGAIRAMGEAGADEIILVLDPITERSIASMRPVLAAL